MESITRHARVAAPYSPESDRPRRSDPSIGNAVAIASLVLTLVTSVISYAVAQARVDTKLEQKVDSADFERALGELRGELRVLKTILCEGRPNAGACR